MIGDGKTLMKLTAKMIYNPPRKRRKAIKQSDVTDAVNAALNDLLRDLVRKANAEKGGIAAGLNIACSTVRERLNGTVR